MIKSFVCFIFTFHLITSPLANIGLDFHLLEHDHHELDAGHDTHDHHHNSSETSHEHPEENQVVSSNVFEALSIVDHEDSEHGIPHDHYRPLTEDTFNLSDADVSLSFQFKCISPNRMSSKLSKIEELDSRKWHRLVALSHYPPPNKYRNLPLLI